MTPKKFQTHAPRTKATKTNAQDNSSLCNSAIQKGVAARNTPFSIIVIASSISAVHLSGFIATAVVSVHRGTHCSLLLAHNPSRECRGDQMPVSKLCNGAPFHLSLRQRPVTDFVTKQKNAAELSAFSIGANDLFRSIPHSIRFRSIRHGVLISQNASGISV